jgi:RNA polymerase sigma-70 factor (ECF subfamily)
VKTAPVAERRNDAELVRAARKDPEAFRDFYRMHADWVYRWILARVGDPLVASDLTAETFAQALASLHRFRGREPGSGTAWIFGIARNLLRRCYERRRLERAARERLGMPIRDYVPDDHDAVDARIAAESLASELEQALGDLTPELRQALELRVVGGLSYRDVAAAVGTSEANVRMRVTRALRSLRISPHQGGEAVVTTLPSHLELLEADLLRAAERRVKQLARRRRRLQVVAVALTMLVMTGAGLAAAGVDLLDWLQGGEGSTARFSVDATTSARGPFPDVIRCSPAAESTFTCAAGQQPGARVYNLLTRVQKPFRFSRESLLERIAAARAAGEIDRAQAHEIRAEVEAVPDDFFAKMNTLSSLQSVGAGVAVASPSGGVNELVPPDGVPLLVTCDREDGTRLRCRNLAGASGVPVGAPVYRLREGPDWVERPVPRDDRGGTQEARALVESIWGRELAPSEARLLRTIVASSGRSEAEAGPAQTVSGEATATNAG